MAVEIVLESAANPLLKGVRKAARGGGLTPDGWALAEGPHLVAEAAASGVEVRVVLLSESASQQAEKIARQSGARIQRVAASAFEQVTSVETTQGVLALVRLPECEPSAVVRRAGLALVLDRLQDPGNVGTILRSAEAFGAAGVLLTPGSAALHHPKTLRASAGSLFRVPCAVLPGRLAAELADDAGRTLYAAVPSGGVALTEADLGSAVVAIGSEAHGVSADLLGVATPLTIPTRRVESLNAATAATVILYEASRARRV
ncbi:MAG: RNA methyltransferase [Acidobacteria bacterium]|nr:RNA methyltransferase [Acidobacteriota bacterium]